MISNYIREKLDINKVNNINDFINVVREECQKIIVYSLGKTDFFNHVAFYGGTCLRLFHNLNRYSEDLDFNVIENIDDIDLNYYAKKAIIDLNSFGFQSSIKTKSEYDIGEMRRRYFNIPIYEIATSYFNKTTFNKEQSISIKLEISTNYVPGAHYERKVLNAPFFATVLCFDYPSLFSGKICALLARNWPNREKGRDFYDYMFYLSNNIKYNSEYLISKLSNSLKTDPKKLTLDGLKEMLRNRFEDTDFNAVKRDIASFAIDRFSVESINKESFVLSVDLLQCE